MSGVTGVLAWAIPSIQNGVNQGNPTITARFFFFLFLFFSFFPVPQFHLEVHDLEEYY